VEWFRRKKDREKGMGIDTDSGRIGFQMQSDTPPTKYDSASWNNNWRWNPETKAYDPIPGGSSYAPAKTLPPCHKYGPVLVFDIVHEDGTLTHIYGGAGREVDLSTVNAIIDLGGSAEPEYTRKSRGFPNAQNVLARTPKATYLHVSTADGGVPKAGKELWDAILQDIVLEKPKELLVCCIGGHGRTGIALSVLAALTGACPEPADPIAWVRAVYCKKAVETDEQIDYIEHVTGRKSLIEPSGFNYGAYTSGVKGNHLWPEPKAKDEKTENPLADAMVRQELDKLEKEDEQNGFVTGSFEGGEDFGEDVGD
jgi:hypothetical protein